MPNHVHNYVVLPNSLMNQINSLGGFSLERFIPTVNLSGVNHNTAGLLTDDNKTRRTLESDLKLINKLEMGVSDYFEQKELLHGAKWDAHSVTSTKLDMFHSLLLFSTPWLPPINPIRALSLRTNQPIKMFSFDEAPNYIGLLEFQNGVVTKSGYFEGEAIDDCAKFEPEIHADLVTRLKSDYLNYFTEDYESKEDEFKLTHGLGYLFGASGETTLSCHQEIIRLAKQLLNFTGVKTYLTPVQGGGSLEVEAIAQEINTLLHSAVYGTITLPLHLAQFVPDEVLAGLSSGVLSLPQCYYSEKDKSILVRVVAVTGGNKNERYQGEPNKREELSDIIEMSDGKDIENVQVVCHGLGYTMTILDEEVDVEIPDFRYSQYLSAVVNLSKMPNRDYLWSPINKLTSKLSHGIRTKLTMEKKLPLTTIMILLKVGSKFKVAILKRHAVRTHTPIEDKSKPAKVTNDVNVTELKVKVPKKELELAIKENKGKELDFEALVKQADNTSIKGWALIATRFTFQLAGRIHNEVDKKKLKPVAYKFIDFKDNTLTISVEHK